MSVLWPRLSVLWPRLSVLRPRLSVLRPRLLCVWRRRPRLSVWRWRRGGRGRCRCGRHRPPTARALRNVRIITSRAIAIVPGLGLWLHLRNRRRPRLNRYRGRDVWIRVGIDRGWVGKPAPWHNPPPAEPVIMPAMNPVPTAPPNKITLVKMVDIAVPPALRYSRSRRGKKYGEYRQCQKCG